MIPNEIPYKRTYIVLINPIGGKGKALTIWNQIRNMLDISYINIKLVNTQYYKHAYEYILKLERDHVYLVNISVTEYFVSLGMESFMK
jgi:diacylglycerol kinase family enzyme